MTTVAKGTKKPSQGSNISLATMEFLMKGQVLGGKRIVGYLLPRKPIYCHGNQKIDFFADQFRILGHKFQHFLCEINAFFTLSNLSITMETKLLPKKGIFWWINSEFYTQLSAFFAFFYIPS